MMKCFKLTCLSVICCLAAGLAHAGDVCNPLSLDACGLPFPSDYWTVASAQSPTGLEIAMDNTLLRPEVAAQLPVESGIDVESIFNGCHGFSAASPVLFEFARRPDEETLPQDGGSAVVAFDLDAARDIEIHAHLSDYARSRRVSAPAEVLEVFPRDRWPFGHRILVAVTKALEIPGETADFAGLAAPHPSGSPQEVYVERLAGALLAAGLDPADIRTATVFTVRDRAEVLQPIRTLVAHTFAGDHPVRDLKVYHATLPTHIVALVTGELRTDNYRRENGTGLVDFDAEPRKQWISFRLTLPRASRENGYAPVAFYAHGLGLFKESDLLVVSNMNARLGIATFSVDFPNHGGRVAADGGYLLFRMDPNSLAVPIGMMTQCIIDFAAAHKALLGLADLDAVGKWTWQHRCRRCSDGVPDIDPDRVLMQGTSMGGVFGSAYAALAPQLDGALFHVAGVGVISLLSGCALWEPLMCGLMPPTATGAEAVMLRGALQQLLDHADAVNYLDLMRTPPNGLVPRPMLVITGSGDNIAPNYTSIALARILEMPLVGEQLYPMPGVQPAGDYDPFGFGVRQYPPLAADLELILGPFVTDISAHTAFLWQKAVDDQKAWIERFILN